MPWRPFSERLLDIEAFEVASMLDSVPVKKKKVEDPGGKWMLVLLGDETDETDETSRSDKRLKLHVNLKR